MTNDDGGTMLSDFESDNVAAIARAGWVNETLEVGDRVGVSGRPGREGWSRLALDSNSVERLD